MGLYVICGLWADLPCFDSAELEGLYADSFLLILKFWVWRNLNNRVTNVDSPIVVGLGDVDL